MAKAELKPLPYVNRPEGPSQGVGRIWKWVIISGIVHVVVIAYLLIGPLLTPNNPPAPPVYSVDLVGGEKLGGGAGTSLAPPPPKSKPEPLEPEVKSAPPVKEVVKPARDEVKEEREAKAKAEMIERIKAKKEAEEKKKVELEAKKQAALEAKKEAEEKKKAEVEAKKKAEQEEAALVKARLEDLRKKRTEAVLEDIRAKAAAKERLEAEQRAAADRAAAERAAAAQQARSTMPGDTPGAATLGHGGTGGGIQASPEFIRYQNIIQDRVKSSWTWVGRRNDLKVTVNASIQENGEITGLRLVGTSGDRSFDDSVLRALKKASPLPPPPSEFRREFSNVILPFNSQELGR